MYLQVDMYMYFQVNNVRSVDKVIEDVVKPKD